MGRTAVAEGRSRRSDRHARPSMDERQSAAQPRYAAYPDDPPQAEPVEPIQSWPQEEGFVPQPTVWEAGGYVPLPDEPQAAPPPQPERRINHAPAGPGGPYLVVLAVCLIALIGMAIFVVQAAQPYGDFKGKQALLARDVFYDGVEVDGVALGGLSRQEAMQRLGQSTQAQADSLLLTVDVDGTRYTITGQQIPYARDVAATLDTAWAIGRQGFSWMIGTDKTPFDIRWEHTQHLKETGARYRTRSTYDAQDVRRVAEWLAQKASRPVQDAMIASFDFDTKAFTVTRDQPGAALDAQAVYEAVTASLDAGRLQDTIRLSAQQVLPQVTSVELQNSFTRLSAFTTETTRDELRNRNILLAARAVMGTTVMPGGTFSFNQVVGERTADKGYQMAPAIAGGITFDEIGGGVCQVSSTLFNAAAMADMTIVTRSPHAWPSSYVDRGRDATVNWPNLDFAFRNDKMTPVFIVASYGNRQLTVEVYGMRADPAERIELETELISTTRPPADAIYQRNPALMPGEQKQLKPARTGYLVDTYRVYLRDGTAYKREKLTTSDYRMVQQVIEYN